MSKLEFIKGIFSHKKSAIIYIMVALLGSISLINTDINSILFIHHIIFIVVVFSFFTALALISLPNSSIHIIAYITYIVATIEILLFLVYIYATGYISGRYISSHQAKHQNYYFRHSPNEEYNLTKAEFDFPRTSNSYGFSDREWKLDKDSNEIRILALGDSFTEGDGADADSTYLKFVERSLKNEYSNLTFMNAGVCGSDPFFNFKALEDILIEFKPDIILQSFTANDFYQDIAIRGGLERFSSDSSIINDKYNYNWEKLYALSYAFRIGLTSIGGYNIFLIKRKEYPKVLEENSRKAINLFDNYQQLANNNHSNLIVFTLPLKGDFMGSKHNLLFHEKFKLQFDAFNLQFYNLQSCYEEYMSKNESTYKDYYWPIDGHHNAQGYEMMAKCIEEIVEPIIVQKQLSLAK